MHGCAGMAPAVVRALPLGRLAAGAAAAVGLAWLLTAQLGDPGAAAALRYPGLALCVAVATLFDDPSASILAAVPQRLLCRRACALAIVVPALATAWVGVVWVVHAEAPVVWTMTLQFVAAVCVTLALAAGLASGGAVAGPIVVVASPAVDAGMPGWAVAPDPGDWRQIALWAGVVALALAAFLIASRDPAARSVAAAA